MVVVANAGAAGSPCGASSKLPVEQHLLPCVQDHDGVDGVDQAAGKHLLLIVVVPLELQGEGK